MRTVEQEERGRVEISRRLAEAGFKPSLIIVSYDDRAQPTGFVCTYDDDLTFDSLEKISKVFGTRNINLGCDCGANSDRCHYRELTVKDIHLVDYWP
jgi:hypothetical protein